MIQLKWTLLVSNYSVYTLCIIEYKVCTTNSVFNRHYTLYLIDTIYRWRLSSTRYLVGKLVGTNLVLLRSSCLSTTSQSVQKASAKVI